jgi:hypothetical protein
MSRDIVDISSLRTRSGSVLADHSYLEREDVLAALEYAASTAQERELVAVSELSDLGVRAHRIAESPEGGLIDDEASIRRLLGL